MVFKFSGILYNYVDYRKEIRYSDPTLASAFDHLLVDFPGLRPVLFDDEDKLRSSNLISVNAKVVDASGGTAVPLGPEDEVQILIAIAGG